VRDFNPSTLTLYMLERSEAFRQTWLDPYLLDIVTHYMGIVPKLSDTPGEVRWQGPSLGEHTGSVLAELGFANEDIERLRREGAVQ